MGNLRMYNYLFDWSLCLNSAGWYSATWKVQCKTISKVNAWLSDMWLHIHGFSIDSLLCLKTLLCFFLLMMFLHTCEWPILKVKYFSNLDAYFQAILQNLLIA
jgi:hypothetical protein